MSISRDDLSFALFFYVWAEIQGWDVPTFHLEILEFLENSNKWRNGTGVLQVFRGAAKSTILALFIVYKLIHDPTLRFLILSADYKTAKRITRDCQGIISTHPLAAHLKGREKTWRTDEFFVRGSNDPRNPSVVAHGIMSNVTGARSDFIIFDDVEVPKNCRSEGLREDLRKRIADTAHIIVPDTGRRLFVGTPHAYDSIYPEIIDTGASSLYMPLLSNIEGEFPYYNGDSRWPERFTIVEIQKRMMEGTKGDFLSQYQLIPYDVEDSVLDPTLLKIYKEEINIHHANGDKVAMIGETRIASVSAFWDVSLSKVRGDDSVLAIVYSDFDGNYYIHRTIELSGDVDEQCKQVKEAALHFELPLIIVETNGVGGFVPQILLKHVRGLGIGVDGRATTKNKAQKIIEAYETPLSGGFLHIHQSVSESKFMSQLRDFKPGNMRDHDDFIDAPASAIDNEPIRIGRGNPVGKPMNFWMREDGGNAEIEIELVSI